MMELKLIRRKIETHGLLLALFYTMQHAVSPFWRPFWVTAVMKSHSQSYEDVIIDRILGNKRDGSYLDIGAFDPHELSNTKRFYEKGWRGCNIEPQPARYERFVQERPGDISLNLGVSDCEGTQVFYDMEPSYLSTFSEERAREVEKMGGKLKRKIDIPVTTMREVFSKWLKDKTVDFCTIDTEGLDLKVLKGNDWTKYRPRVLCVEAVEIAGSATGAANQETVANFLHTVGYKKVHSTKLFGNQLNEIYVSNAEQMRND